MCVINLLCVVYIIAAYVFILRNIESIFGVGYHSAGAVQ